MKILITGGAGFIGAHVVDAYIAAGHDVVIVDNLSTGQRSNLNPLAVFYECDITSKEALAKIFAEEKPDVVNHHAAQMNVRKSVDDPEFDAQVNIIGLLNVLACSAAHGVKRFIFISSGGAMYGDAKQIPTPESNAAIPLSPYGLAKMTGEYYVQFYAKKHGFSYVVLRYANVYGPLQNPEGEAGVIAIFISKMLKGQAPQIFGDGKQTRDYIYVADVVSANIAALSRGDNNTFNIGTGEEISVSDLFVVLKEQLEFVGNVEYVDAKQGEVFRSCLDITHGANDLGWKPEHDLELGLAKTIEWFGK